jgi:hypothetical protein
MSLLFLILFALSELVERNVPAQFFRELGRKRHADSPTI